MVTERPAPAATAANCQTAAVTPPPSAAATRPVSRRGALTGIAAAVLGLGTAGCGVLTGGSAQQSTPPDPLEPLIRAKASLLGSYDAVLARHPGLAAELRPLRADHAAHLAALVSQLDVRRRVVLFPEHREQGTDRTSTPAPSSRTVPASPGQARAQLRAGERAAAARSRAACLAATGDRAALLGSIAACERSHGVVLT